MSHRGAIAVFAASISLAALYGLPALGEKGASGPRSFTFDGRLYLSGDGRDGAMSLLREELARMGIPAATADEALSFVDPVGAVPLRDAGPDPDPPGGGRLPEGFLIRSHLGMETGSGTVAIGLGVHVYKRGEIDRRLRDDGWTISPGSIPGAPVLTATRTKGDQHDVLVLEEEGREFALVRRVGD